VDVGWGIQPDAGMPMRVVVILDEVGHERPRFTHGVEAFGELWGEFEGLEPALAVIPNSG
jgi:hypothetical protein